MSLVSLVIPIHNERENLAPLMREIDGALTGMEFEVLAVDDGSTDGSLGELRRVAPSHDRLRIVSLARRRGQSAAILAGVDAAGGTIVVTLDGDRQNDPAEVPRLVERLEADEDLAAVVGYRVQRADSGWKRLQSRVANTVRNLVTGDSVRDTGCSLKAMRREVVETLPRFDGMHRFLPTLIRYSGGRVLEVPVSHRPRVAGVTKYGMKNRALRGLRDALGVRWLGKRRLDYHAGEEASRDA